MIIGHNDAAPYNAAWRAGELARFFDWDLGLPGFDSCAPGGIIRLLAAYQVELVGRHAVVIGRSPILGKPIGMLLLAQNATVTMCHSQPPTSPRSNEPPTSS